VFVLFLILHFIFITFSIVLFTAPFFLWFWWAHRARLHETAGSFHLNTYLEHFFSSTQANWLILAWAASEAVFWFVIPEFLLLLVVFMRIRRKRQMLLFDIAGTLLGTGVALVLRLPEAAIDKLPYIQERMISQTHVWYNEQGIWGLANQPFSGVPYKVFTHLAGDYRFPLLLFLIVAVVVRILRYLIAYGLFISLYPKLHRIVRRNYIPLAFGAIFIFSLLLYKTYRLYG
jgi:membrane protein YqaA with SNARE-associated domain